MRRARSPISRPTPPPAVTAYKSNDVTVEARGLIYLIDRLRGLTIVERV
jgi:hypothetical protein